LESKNIIHYEANQSDSLSLNEYFECLSSKKKLAEQDMLLTQLTTTEYQYGKQNSAAIDS
jgi:hypothetical protein